ncbi:hypothetical protein GCM10027294_49090 [Marinactinospora endophytica]
MLTGWHVRVGGAGQFPGDTVTAAEEAQREGGGLRVLLGVAGVVRVDAERAQDPGEAVGLVVSEGLAGPLARDQDAPTRIAQVFTAVGFGGAEARPQPGFGVLGLDAVAQPVRTPRRARLEPQRVEQSCFVPGSLEARNQRFVLL